MMRWMAAIFKGAQNTSHEFCAALTDPAARNFARTRAARVAEPAMHQLPSDELSKTFSNKCGATIPN
jgi:hypothetical protein